MYGSTFTGWILFLSLLQEYPGVTVWKNRPAGSFLMCLSEYYCNHYMY